jgi:hypothetical protein
VAFDEESSSGHDVDNWSRKSHGVHHQKNGTPILH